MTRLITYDSLPEADHTRYNTWLALTRREDSAAAFRDWWEERQAFLDDMRAVRPRSFVTGDLR